MSSRARALVPLALAGAMLLLLPARGAAHFMITAPTSPPQPATVQSWMSEDSVGGPQKNGPCAATPNTSLGDSKGTVVANSLTVVQPGQKVTVPVTVTVAHPGWFRIALAQGASSTQTLTTLPDPKAMSGTNCTPPIMSNPVWSTTQPIIADGLPAGSTASTQQSGKQSFQVTIPSNASCSTAQPCSLQIIMVMTDHPASDCYYHHCADVAVATGTSDGGASGSAGAAAGGHGGSAGTGGAGNAAGGPGSGGTGGTGTGGTGTGGLPGTGGKGTGGTTTTGTGGTGGSAASTGGATGTGGQPGGTGTGGASTGGGDSSSSSAGGCAVAGHGRASWALGAAGLLALVILRRRRRA
jgi:MYXO-CTERM domain-containing protein